MFEAIGIHKDNWENLLKNYVGIDKNSRPKV
jgi:hypothetical protein